MPRYNGHLNWNYWNVSLWINNDERLYNLARDCVRQNRTKTQAAKAFLVSMHRTTKTPDGATYTVPSVRAAMSDM
jgi:hypothetical protein